MKRIKFKYLIILFTIISSCTPSNNQNNSKILVKNNMDFPNLKVNKFKEISFNLSSMFTKDVNANYIMKKSSFSKYIYDLDIYFSVEVFTKGEAEKIQSNFNGSIDGLNAIIDNYIIKREKSVFNPLLSLKKRVPKSVRYPGYIQVVEGSSSKYYPATSYFISTLKVGNDFFVFQLIGKQKNMGYILDDFIDLLSSVKKIK